MTDTTRNDYTLPWPPHSRPHNISAFNIWALWLNYNIWALWLNYNIWASCSILQYLGLMFSTSYRDHKKIINTHNDNVLCWNYRDLTWVFLHHQTSFWIYHKIHILFGKNQDAFMNNLEVFFVYCTYFRFFCSVCGKCTFLNGKAL